MSSGSAGGAVPGLRESKKQATRQQISDHATRLFLAQGFEQTTIAEIATSAGVAAKTVTNYFARKEDLALDRQDEFVSSLAAAVASRRSGQSALAALRTAFDGAVQVQDPVAGFSGPSFARMVAQSPTLTARLRRLHDEREVALVEALADAVGRGPADIEVRTAGAVLGAVHRILFQRIQELTLGGERAELIADAVAADAAQAFGLLEPALGEFAVAP
ncbi:TetR/AcrR family transcriptional regulator [Ruania zhangjianzhongii]|uniref:TetR/AcrR family transcriptional regulator n=1 Tax=Ruania zhangjianzhongii TaxID=2603206 RepID=UPI0011C7FDC9|nr:TetR family transcriptional regulator [Ruania zhangjianzhongii]